MLPKKPAKLLKIMPYESFFCTKCGECCRHISVIAELSDFDDGTGVCVHLKNNLCEIYDTRPDICRVDVMYERMFKDYYTKEEFYELNMQSCKILQQTKL